MDNTIPSQLYEIINKSVKGNIEKFIINHCEVSNKGDGFSGQLFFISLRKKMSGKQLHLVIKVALADSHIREKHPICEGYLNEINFYTKLWPRFTKFQKSISVSYRCNNVPNFFAAIAQENSEQLALENLITQGFFIHDKKKPLRLDQFELIFKIYGKFHAISFAYKALHPEEFSDLSKGVIDVWSMYIEKDLFQQVMRTSHEHCLDVLKGEVENLVLEQYKHHTDNAVKLLKRSLVNGKYIAVVHGDCWSNNIMFKTDELENIIDIKLLDFQNLRIGSPVCDLSYCLYSGGTKDIFNKLDHLLHVYHHSLSESLKAYGCDSHDLYPLEALKKDWKTHCPLGITMGVAMWKIKLTYESDMADLSDISEDGETTAVFNTNYDRNAFKERTRDLILHCFENDYLV